MIFDSNLNSFFSAKKGAYSEVTEREFYDSQITLTGEEAEIVIDYFKKENIHVGKVSDDKFKASKDFFLYPHMSLIHLNVVFPKISKPELRLYLSASKGFKPNSKDVWFVFVDEQNNLVIGSCAYDVWQEITSLKNGKKVPLITPRIKIFNIAVDKVIGSYVGLGESSYEYALEKIYPLSHRFHAQRKVLESKLYERLERDILEDCLMPPITLAFVETGLKLESPEDLENYINKNIHNGYILDGLQRLTTLNNASKKKGFNNSKELFYNVIISENPDRLLYRMITLNNGQKGMTPRHQIEILTQELFNFDRFNISVQTEKQKSETSVKSAYSLGDLSRGYLAFLTSNVHNENSKIIEEKMDEILVGRILDADLEDNKVKFTDIIHFLEKVDSNTYTKAWLQVANNFIGFCVGAKSSYDFIFDQKEKYIESALQNFEAAFKIVNPSKINVGKFRRELSEYFISNADDFFNKDVNYISDKFVYKTISE